MCDCKNEIEELKEDIHELKKVTIHNQALLMDKIIETQNMFKDIVWKYERMNNEEK